MPYGDNWYHGYEWKKLRREAKRELDYRCQQCGSTECLELDHIVNRARGGADTLENVQWLCRDCHRVKSSREASERRGRFRRETPPPLGLGREGGRS